MSVFRPDGGRPDSVKEHTAPPSTEVKDLDLLYRELPRLNPDRESVPLFRALNERQIEAPGNRVFTTALNGDCIVTYPPNNQLKVNYAHLTRDGSLIWSIGGGSSMVLIEEKNDGTSTIIRSSGYDVYNANRELVLSTNPAAKSEHKTAPGRELSAAELKVYNELVMTGRLTPETVKQLVALDQHRQTMLDAVVSKRETTDPSQYSFSEKHVKMLLSMDAERIGKILDSPHRLDALRMLKDEAVTPQTLAKISELDRMNWQAQSDSFSKANAKEQATALDIVTTKKALPQPDKSADRTELGRLIKAGDADGLFKLAESTRDLAVATKAVQELTRAKPPNLMQLLEHLANGDSYAAGQALHEFDMKQPRDQPDRAEALFQKRLLNGDLERLWRDGKLELSPVLRHFDYRPEFNAVLARLEKFAADSPALQLELAKELLRPSDPIDRHRGEKFAIEALDPQRRAAAMRELASSPLMSTESTLKFLALCPDEKLSRIGLSELVKRCEAAPYDRSSQSAMMSGDYLGDFVRGSFKMPVDSVDRLRELHTALAEKRATLAESKSVFYADLGQLEDEPFASEAVQSWIENRETDNVDKMCEHLQKYPELLAQYKQIQNLEQEVNVALQARDTVLQPTADRLQQHVDALTDSLGLPRAKVTLDTTGKDFIGLYTDGTGKILVRLESFLKNDGAKAQALSTTAHEVVHLEQDTLVVRAICDEVLGSKSTADAEARARIIQIYKNGSGSAFLKDGMHCTLQSNFLDAVLQSRTAPLDDAQRSRANKVMQSTHDQWAADERRISLEIKRASLSKRIGYLESKTPLIVILGPNGKNVLESKRMSVEFSEECKAEVREWLKAPSEALENSIRKRVTAAFGAELAKVNDELYKSYRQQHHEVESHEVQYRAELIAAAHARGIEFKPAKVEDQTRRLVDPPAKPGSQGSSDKGDRKKTSTPGNGDSSPRETKSNEPNDKDTKPHAEDQKPSVLLKEFRDAAVSFNTRQEADIEAYKSFKLADFKAFANLFVRNNSLLRNDAPFAGLKLTEGDAAKLILRHQGHEFSPLYRDRDPAKNVDDFVLENGRRIPVDQTEVEAQLPKKLFAEGRSEDRATREKARTTLESEFGSMLVQLDNISSRKERVTQKQSPDGKPIVGDALTAKIKEQAAADDATTNRQAAEFAKTMPAQTVENSSPGEASALVRRRSTTEARSDSFQVVLDASGVLKVVDPSRPETLQDLDTQAMKKLFEQEQREIRDELAKVSNDKELNEQQRNEKISVLNARIGEVRGHIAMCDHPKYGKPFVEKMGAKMKEVAAKNGGRIVKGTGLAGSILIVANAVLREIDPQ